MTTPRRHSLHVLLAFALLVSTSLGLATSGVLAQSVDLRIASNEAYVGEPLRAVVEISDVEQFDGPFVPSVDGLEIRRLANEQTSTRVEIVNGRVRQEKTVAITFEITPRRVGTFVVPEFRVESGGRTFLTKPLELQARISDAGDLLRAFVRVRPSPLYVGQKGTLDLEIAVRRYRDEQLGITLDEASLWSLVDTQGSEWGAFFPTLQKLASEGKRPRGEVREIDGTECIVFTVTRPFDPIAAGPPATGDLRIRMEYPTALRRGNDLFFENRVTLAGSRPITVVPEPAGGDVLSPPEDGRPASWNGAVGDFEIRATARPIEVAVGEPITVTLRVTDLSGSAGLEGLLAPDLAAQDGFAERFRVPRDATTGTVEGSSKLFTQSIRALSERVDAIPPIEFSYFDPRVGDYRTIQSDPIPIRVRPSAIARAERPARDALDEPEVPAAPTRTAVAGGLVANASPAQCAVSGTATIDLILITAVPPMALAALTLAAGRFRRTRDRRLELRARARADFEASMASDASAASVEQSLIRYVGARLGATGDGLARRDALDLLGRAGVDALLVEETDRVLRRCERARYLGGEGEPQAARDLVARLEQATTAWVPTDAEVLR